MLNTYKLAYIGFEIDQNPLKNIIYVEKQGSTITPMEPSSDYMVSDYA